MGGIKVIWLINVRDHCVTLINLTESSVIWLWADLYVYLQKSKLEVHTPNVAHNIVPMKLDEVQPPDHVDGLRMEQDGHLNHDYKKEIIIGNHEEFEEPGSEKKLVARLKIIFLR